MHKLVQLLRAVKYMLLNVLAWAVGFFVKIPEHLWLISERGFDARDNGYWMFRYMREQHHEIDTVFIITKDSADYGKVQAIGSTVEYGSFLHYIYMMHAEALLSTHDCGYTPDSILYHHMAKHGLFKPHGVQVFLQHGISDKIIQWYFRSECKPDVFILASEEEYQNIHNNHHQPDDVLCVTGFPRFDNLMDAKPEKLVLVMPTWRQFLKDVSESEFRSSDYHKNYMELLDNEQLNAFLEESGYQLVFYPHIEMQKFMPECTCRNITIASMEHYDVQDLLKRCQLLVTDYSSVYFDVAYMEKPIIFYQFDKDRYEGEHYEKCTIPHERFGPVVSEADQAAGLIIQTIQAQERGTYENKDSGFFKYHDRNNCERVYVAVCEATLDKRRR